MLGFHIKLCDFSNGIFSILSLFRNTKEKPIRAEHNGSIFKRFGYTLYGNTVLKVTGKKFSVKKVTQL